MRFKLLLKRIATLYRTFIYGHGPPCARLSDRYEYPYFMRPTGTDWFLHNLINGSFQNALFYVYLKPVHISQRRRYSVRTL